MFAYLLIIGLIWLGIAILIVHKKTGDWLYPFRGNRSIKKEK